MLALLLCDRHLTKTQAGNYVKEQILSSFVRLIATTPELQTYSVQKLYASLKDDISQEGLNLAGAWVIGEYGDALLRGGQYEEEELVQEVKQSEVVDLFTAILNSSYAGQSVKEYIITAAMKLTTRLTEAAQVERLRRLLESNNVNLDIEIQQRAVEYGNLFAYDEIRRGVLERMPPPEIREEQRVLGEATKRRTSKILNKKKPAQVTEQDMLLDLMGESSMPSADVSSTLNGSQNNADLLADILGGDLPAASPPPQQVASPGPGGNMSAIMDLFDGPAAAQPSGPQSSAHNDLVSGLSSPSPQQTQQTPGHVVYEKNDLSITFQVQRSATAIQVIARFRNTSPLEQFSDVGLQAAVPKSQKLQLQGISTSDLSGGQEATQQMRIISVQGVSSSDVDSLARCTDHVRQPPPAKLRLRLKIGYTKAGSSTAQEQVDWAEPS